MGGQTGPLHNMADDALGRQALADFRQSYPGSASQIIECDDPDFRCGTSGCDYGVTCRFTPEGQEAQDAAERWLAERLWSFTQDLLMMPQSEVSWVFTATCIVYNGIDSPFCQPAQSVNWPWHPH
jgi:hypothetical protein